MLPEVTLLLEACAGCPADPERTAQLRRRVLAALLVGIAAEDVPRSPLPGPPPEAAELSWR